MPSRVSCNTRQLCTSISSRSAVCDFMAPPFTVRGGIRLLLQLGSGVGEAASSGSGDFAPHRCSPEKISRKNRKTFSTSRKIDAASSGAEAVSVLVRSRWKLRGAPYREPHADQGGEGGDEGDDA